MFKLTPYDITKMWPDLYLVTLGSDSVKVSVLSRTYQGPFNNMVELTSRQAGAALPIVGWGGGGGGGGIQLFMRALSSTVFSLNRYWR